jgi:hypothetical protein
MNTFTSREVAQEVQGQCVALHPDHAPLRWTTTRRDADQIWPTSSVSLRREPDSVWDQVLQNQPSIGARFRIPIKTLAYLLIVERSRAGHDGQDLRTRHMSRIREARRFASARSMAACSSSGVISGSPSARRRLNLSKRASICRSSPGTSADLSARSCSSCARKVCISTAIFLTRSGSLSQRQFFPCCVVQSLAISSSLAGNTLNGWHLVRSVVSDTATSGRWRDEACPRT